MAQTASPYGLSLINTVDSNYSGTLQTLPIASGTLGNIFMGDPVIYTLSGDGLVINGTPNGYSLSNTFGTSLITSTYDSKLGGNYNARTSRPILGVAQGVTYTNPQGQKLRQQYWASGTTTFTANNLGPNSQTMNIDGLLTINPATAIYKIQGYQKQAYTSIQQAKDNLLFRQFNFYFASNNAANGTAANTVLYNTGTVPYNGQSTVSLDLGTNGGNAVASGPVTVIGVAMGLAGSNTQGATSNIGAQWLDPYPDLLVRFTNPLFGNF